MSCIVSVCCYQTCHYREARCKITNSCDSVEDPHNEVTKQISPLFSVLLASFLSLNTLSIFIFLQFSLVDIFHLSIFSQSLFCESYQQVVESPFVGFGNVTRYNNVTNSQVMFIVISEYYFKCVFYIINEDNNYINCHIMWNNLNIQFNNQSQTPKSSTLHMQGLFSVSSLISVTSFRDELCIYRHLFK